MRSKVLGTCALALMAMGVVACGQADEASETSGRATGATCPQDSQLTYETFTRDFMRDYCTRCHSASVASADRNGAPSDHDFDTLAGLRATASAHLDEQAASGPDAENAVMPPTEPRPSPEERRKLGEWLACGMP